MDQSPIVLAGAASATAKAASTPTTATATATATPTTAGEHGELLTLFFLQPLNLRLQEAGVSLGEAEVVRDDDVQLFEVGSYEILYLC